MKKIYIFLLLGLFLSVRVIAADLTVSAAASLSHAFKEVATIFESQNPSIKVQLNFAASGVLLQQIVKGAPVDVFASADQVTMDQAQEQALINPMDRKNFTSNTLVVIVPKKAKSLPLDLNDLTKDKYQKIAIGLPGSVPVGRYTKAVLETKKIWSLIEPKMIGSQNVRQALDYVARGEVDAGFVYSTDAAMMSDKVSIAFVVPTGAPIFYPIAPVASSQNYTMAKKFVTLVNSPQGQNILSKYGFSKP